MIVACIHLHSSFKFRKWFQLLSSILREPKFYHLLVCWRWASSDTPHDDLVTHRQLTSQSCHWPHCDVQHISTSLYASLTSLLHAIPDHTVIWCTSTTMNTGKKTGNKKDMSNIKHQWHQSASTESSCRWHILTITWGSSPPLPSDSPTPDELRIWSKQWTNQTCWAYFNLSM